MQVLKRKAQYRNISQGLHAHSRSRLGSMTHTCTHTRTHAHSLNKEVITAPVHDDTIWCSGPRSAMSMLYFLSSLSQISQQFTSNNVYGVIM